LEDTLEFSAFSSWMEYSKSLRNNVIVVVYQKIFSSHKIIKIYEGYVKEGGIEGYRNYTNSV